MVTMGVQSMAPNLSSYILNRVLPLTVDQKKRERICVMGFPPKSLFSIVGQLSPGTKGDRYIAGSYQLPHPTLQSYFKLGSRLFPEPFHLSAFPHATPFPLPTCGAFPYPSILQTLLLYHLLQEGVIAQFPKQVVIFPSSGSLIFMSQEQ